MNAPRALLLATAVVGLALGGCATIVNDELQPLRIDTLTPEGRALAGAHCTLSGEGAVTVVPSGGTLQVRRSSQALNIVCKHPEQPDAAARLVSRVHAAMFGNVLAGGLIGAVIDHNKGTAYSYPGWVQLVFGQTLVFDRLADDDAHPAPASVATARQ